MIYFAAMQPRIFRFIILLLFLPHILSAQFNVTPGTKLILHGGVKLILNNTSFQNQGSFSAGASSVTFTGQNFNFITGPSAIVYNNLTIDKPAGQLILQAPINVDGAIKMAGGNLFLNSFTLNLDSTGIILGENENSKIYDTGSGKIVITTVINGPLQNNPGNIGLEFSNSSNLGRTVVTRGFRNLPLNNGYFGISRYFNFEPLNTSGLSVSLKYLFFNSELSGQNTVKSLLTFWASTDGGSNWTNLGQDNRDTSQNWVVKNNVTQAGLVVLANGSNAALPVSFLDFKGELVSPRLVKLYWTVSNLTGNSNYFEIEKSTDGVFFSRLGTVYILDRNQSKYSMYDDKPSRGYNYYRIKQVDIDNKFIYSNTTRVNVNGTGPMLFVYPNPATSFLNITYYSTLDTDALVNLYSINGVIAGVKKVHLLKGTNNIRWNIQQLTPGIYNIEIKGHNIKYIQFIKL